MKKVLKKTFSSQLNMLCILVISLFFVTGAAQPTHVDWMTGSPREAIHINEWPGGKKVAVCFILYVEEWGQGLGPNFRPEMIQRKPDLVNESFRQYGIHIGVPRVGMLFKDEDTPLSIALNALYPEKYPVAWKKFRSLVPNAPIIAHGMNNSTEMLPLNDGMKAQTTYIRKVLDIIEKDTGIRPHGWSSPSVYANADTFAASAAAGITYSLDAMDSDTLSRLDTKYGKLILIPYPTTTVDMGQYFQYARDLEHLWLDYITELTTEAATHPEYEATVVAIGIHPFLVGTPDGAAALRKVIQNLKKQKLVWLTDVEAVIAYAYPSESDKPTESRG